MTHCQRWKCHSCRSDFREPEKWYSGSSFDHSPDDLICPFCKSELIEEAYQCDLCGGYFFYDELTYGLCENCIEDYAVDHAEDYVKHDPDLWDAFACWMSIRIGGDED